MEMLDHLNAKQVFFLYMKGTLYDYKHEEITGEVEN